MTKQRNSEEQRDKAIHKDLNGLDCFAFGSNDAGCS